MKRLWFVAVLALGVTLSACIGLNLPVEGPDGRLGIVLGEQGTYNLIPEGGAVWVLEADGRRGAELLVLQENETAVVSDWAPDGQAVLAVISEGDEMGFPSSWRLSLLHLDGSVEYLVQTESLILSPRFESSGDVLFMQMNDMALHLQRLSIESGTVIQVAEHVLAYLVADERVYVLHADGQLRDLEGGELPLRLRCAEEACSQEIPFLSVILFASDPTGRYLALTLEDVPALTTPEVDADSSLYLVDLEEESAVRIASTAMSPAFSPQGGQLAFVAEPLGGRPQVVLYDLADGTVELLPGSEGAVWVRWGHHSMLAALETPAGAYRLVRYRDGTWTELSVGGSDG